MQSTQLGNDQLTLQASNYFCSKTLRRLSATDIKINHDLAEAETAVNEPGWIAADPAAETDLTATNFWAWAADCNETGVEASDNARCTYAIGMKHVKKPRSII